MLDCPFCGGDGVEYYHPRYSKCIQCSGKGKLSEVDFAKAKKSYDEMCQTQRDQNRVAEYRAMG